MISIIVTTISIILSIIIGSYPYAYKKSFNILKHTASTTLGILDNKSFDAKNIKADDTTKEYLEIYSIKKGQLGMKKQKTISIVGIIITLISLALIIVDQSMITDNIITKWIINNIYNNTNLVMTTYTAVTFSLFSFGLTRVLSTWKNSKEYRKERKILKIKQKAYRYLTAKELLEVSKKKDLED